MTTPRVGVLVAMTFACAIDDHHRYTKAISVRRNRLQRPDFKERGPVRAVLHEAGHLILTGSLKGCTSTNPDARQRALGAPCAFAEGAALV
jgi:hypothetical protein